MTRFIFLVLALVSSLDIQAQNDDHKLGMNIDLYVKEGQDPRTGFVNIPKEQRLTIIEAIQQAGVTDVKLFGSLYPA